MADKSIVDTISDWWNAKPQAPTPYRIKGVPQTNRPSDMRTLQRYGPSSYLSPEEGLANIWNNLHPLDFMRDTTKALYSAAKTVVTDPGKALDFAKNASESYVQVMAAQKAEETGKWDDSLKGYIKPQDMQAWKNEARRKYRTVASTYSYVGKDGKRHFDSAGLARNLTQRPMDVLTLLTPVTEITGAKLAASTSAPVRLAGEAMRLGSKGVNVAANLPVSGAAKVVKGASNVAAAGARAAGVVPPFFTKAGEWTPKMQKAFRDAGVNPELFDSDEMVDVLGQVIDKKGISPAAIKEAVLKTQGIQPTRSMTTGQRPMAGNVADEGNVRQEARATLAQNMQDNVEAAYKQATSHRGTFTNTADFSSGVRQAVDDELAAMGLSLADVQGNVRFAEAQKALQGTKGFPGVFDQFDDLAGVQKAAAAPPPKPLTVDFGGKHTFDYNKGHWVDPNGVPVTKPNVINALDNISDRKNIPAPAVPAAPSQGPNRLTPQNIDSVRRNVNSRFSKAEGDDAAVLAAINRGIDNYTVQNAANFTGDGAAMASDWVNARKTSQLAQQQYKGAPPADPFAPPKPPVAYDPNALARTEAARGIVQAPANMPNSSVPTIWENIKRYVPSVGAGNIGGYTLGAATGLPGMGLVGGAIGGAATGAARGGLDLMAARRAAQAEFAGAPTVPLFKAPDVRIPANLVQGVTAAAQGNYQMPVEAPPPPKAPAPAQAPRSTLLPDEISYEQYQKGYGQESPKAQGAQQMLPGEISYEEYQKSLQPQPQARGGRAAYKSGGKVGGIEHLVQALMTKAKTAKKVSNKATEPLLNERDDAIANALAVAQKAI